MATIDAWKTEEDQFPTTGPLTDRLRFLVRYAVLAPSSHNTQPWKFRIADDRIDVFMDQSRWLKVADDDQRELHISIACALENQPAHCSRAFQARPSDGLSARPEESHARRQGAI